MVGHASALLRGKGRKWKRAISQLFTASSTVVVATTFNTRLTTNRWGYTMAADGCFLANADYV